MRMLLLIAISVALTGGSAAAASFDCKKAKTKAEKLICATPELSKADEELGRQYKAARQATKDAKALRRAQTAWLRSQRDACADAACMLAAYEGRIAELRATAKPTGRTGSYSATGSENSVEVLEIAPGVLRFELSAFYSTGQSVNTGQLCGEITIKSNKGEYGKGCQLTWTFGKDGSLMIRQPEACDDFGANVTADGAYKKQSSDPPALEFCSQYGYR